MADRFTVELRRAQKLEGDAILKLDTMPPPSPELFAILRVCRECWQKLISNHLENVLRYTSESPMWGVIFRVASALRNLLKRSAQNTSAKVLDHRRLVSTYISLIKDHQRFYKFFIQTINDYCGGIPEISEFIAYWNKQHPPGSDVALSGKLNTIRNNYISAVAAEITISTPADDVKQLAIRRCYFALINLADLSRYRACETISKTKNWGPAFDLYRAASILCPDEAHAHNGLAAIAFAEQDHLCALFHVYRSLTTGKPHPQGKGNLEKELRRISVAHSLKTLASSVAALNGNQNGSSLIAWFLWLHAKCYPGIEFPEKADLEKEVITQFKVQLKDPSFKKTLNQFVVINIAAEYFASNRIEGAGTSSECLGRAAFFFVSLNVIFFTALLEVLTKELKLAIGADGTTSQKVIGTGVAESNKLSDVSRRVLPCIRIYNAWLLIKWPLLTPTSLYIKEPLRGQVINMWSAYADTMAMLSRFIDPDGIPTIGYMLNEDLDLNGFLPIVSDVTRRLWYMDNGRMKEKFIDRLTNRLTEDTEMLVRARDILYDAHRLATTSTIPLEFEESGKVIFSTANGMSPIQGTRDTSSRIGLVNSLSDDSSSLGEGKSSDIRLSSLCLSGGITKDVLRREADVDSTCRKRESYGLIPRVESESFAFGKFGVNCIDGNSGVGRYTGLGAIAAGSRGIGKMDGKMCSEDFSKMDLLGLMYERSLKTNGTEVTGIRDTTGAMDNLDREQIGISYAMGGTNNISDDFASIAVTDPAMTRMVDALVNDTDAELAAMSLSSYDNTNKLSGEQNGDYDVVGGLSNSFNGLNGRKLVPLTPTELRREIQQKYSQSTNIGSDYYNNRISTPSMFSRNTIRDGDERNVISKLWGTDMKKTSSYDEVNMRMNSGRDSLESLRVQSHMPVRSEMMNHFHAYSLRDTGDALERCKFSGRRYPIPIDLCKLWRTEDDRGVGERSRNVGKCDNHCQDYTTFSGSLSAPCIMEEGLPTSPNDGWMGNSGVLRRTAAQEYTVTPFLFGAGGGTWGADSMSLQQT